MLFNILLIIILFVLFYFLGKTADLVIFYLRKIGRQLGLKIYFLGLLLGIFTNLPELAVGINALINNIEGIIIGNLLGSSMVLFGFILGFGAILHRKIKTTGRVISFAPIALYIFLPLILGLKGYFNIFDGLIIVALYLILLYYLYRQNNNNKSTAIRIIKRGQTLKYILIIVFGAILLLIISNLVVQVATVILNRYDVSAFILGILIFTIGTNLPEIIIVFKSWSNNIKGLSISTLTGSAMVHVMLLGFFSLIKPIHFQLEIGYYILMIFAAIILLIVTVFYKTGFRFTRLEGFVLLIIYLLFILTQLIFIN